MAESLRVMKPGACGLVWSIPRTSHWTGMALELAGFRLIDIIHHCQGSGFPKGQDIGKSIDALYNAKREVILKTGVRCGVFAHSGNGAKQNIEDYEKVITAPTTPEAKQWDGWKTPALKPAIEGWWLIQKPISESSIARNILKHGVGGLNIEACRIEPQDKESFSKYWDRDSISDIRGGNYNNGKSGEMDCAKYNAPSGRYPANLILSCSADCDGDNHSPDCPVSVIGEQSGISVSTGGKTKTGLQGSCYGDFKNQSLAQNSGGLGDTGTAARYFKQLPFDPETVNSVYYQAKASTKDRTCDGTVENTHPTVKSTALMEYFIKLITPPNGMVLDPFGGSGTTGVAAKNLGFNYTLIEREQEYIEIINQRLNN
jgi:site-specific DNA-methyltransferase (adenine-specific)